MKSMVAEMTDETNVAQAWGILPFTWSFGTTLGSVFRHPLCKSFVLNLLPKATDWWDLG